MAFVFHELENPVAFMEEVKRVCKPLAYVGIVDWKKEVKDDNRKGSYTIETDYQRPR